MAFFTLTATYSSILITDNLRKRMHVRDDWCFMLKYGKHCWTISSYIARLPITCGILFSSFCSVCRVMLAFILDLVSIRPRIGSRLLLISILMWHDVYEKGKHINKVKRKQNKRAFKLQEILCIIWREYFSFTFSPISACVWWRMPPFVFPPPHLLLMRDVLVDR